MVLSLPFQVRTTDSVWTNFVFVYMLMRDVSLNQRIPCIIINLCIPIFGSFSAGKKCTLYRGKYSTQLLAHACNLGFLQLWCVLTVTCRHDFHTRPSLCKPKGLKRFYWYAYKGNDYTSLQSVKKELNVEVTIQKEPDRDLLHLSHNMEA